MGSCTRRRRSRSERRSTGRWLAIQATRKSAAKTTEFNKRSAKFWEPLRATRVPILRRAKIEDMIAERAKEHPKSAKNELEFLKRVLHEAKGRGQRVEEAIFEIPPVKHRPRVGRGADRWRTVRARVLVPRARSRLIVIAGQVGCRQNVWFNLTEKCSTSKPQR